MRRTQARRGGGEAADGERFPPQRELGGEIAGWDESRAYPPDPSAHWPLGPSAKAAIADRQCQLIVAPDCKTEAPQPTLTTALGKKHSTGAGFAHTPPFFRPNRTPAPPPTVRGRCDPHHDSNPSSGPKPVLGPPAQLRVNGPMAVMRARRGCRRHPRLPLGVRDAGQERGVIMVDGSRRAVWQSHLR